MRVISGKYKGRRFTPPKGFKGRPTTDFAKEAIFSILENRYDFSDCHVLDLFSGSGSLGLEFISRGAKSVLSVDNQSITVKNIQSICRELSIENWHVVRSDVKIFCTRINKGFDLILADPPFDYKETEGLPDLILTNKIVNDNGLLIIEHSKRNQPQNTTHFEQMRKYGDLHFSFYAMK